ncbi:hybrid sensor histidine kinase/response regulator transcription factor [Prevotella sp.]|uniref:hybrid sensor histidine kinase/response regulator transcription factor n=1 Tax=Prevotella sp. TaxID=59823 RepID=UPI002648CCA8|nr:hybrid sensor histidine kinase/response regulator transcription factor [Prevotella sp.]MDN5553076.1 response regulator [Prevotella sp.]
MRNLRTICLVIAVSIASILHANVLPQYSRDMFIFDHLGMSSGLSSQRIYSIIEGPYGGMWFSSKNGIDRYNGIQIKNYNFKTTKMYSDASGRNVRVFFANASIYAFDNKGNLFIYNRRLDSFENKLSLDSLIHGEIILNDVYVDKNYNIWFAMNTGLYTITPNKKLIRVIRNRYINKLNHVGNSLIACANDGIIFVDTKRYKAANILNKINAQVTYYDKLTSYLWIGTFQQGIKIYDMHHHKISKFKAFDNLPKTPVRSIIPMDKKMMLIGVDGGGVYAAKRDGTTVSLLFNADDNTGNVLHGNGIYDICRDHYGNIWIGSYSGGIDIAYPTDNVMKLFQHEYLNNQSLINNNVNDVLETQDGNIWFATDRGVSIYNKKLGIWHHAMTDKVVLTLCRNASGVLAGTYGNGVYSINSEGRACSIYSVSKGTLKTDYVYSLWKDNDNTLWIGCLNGDLVQVDGNKKKYYPIQLVQCITDMPDGRIAVGTVNGVFAVNKESGSFKQYFLASEFPGKDINSYVQSILFVNHNTAWIATDGGGIYIYDMKKHVIKQTITKANGLPSNTVYTLEKDNQNRIFASTDMGLSLILPEKGNDVIDINFVRGLDREYKRMSVCRLSDGKMVFGSSSGAVVINPDRISHLTYNAKLILTKISLLGNDNTTDKDSDLNGRLYDMLASGDITLDYDKNTFEIDFESINYKYQHDIVYQYMLDGFDRQWSAPSEAQNVKYTNLPSGNYKLLIRSISRNDGRVLDTKSLDITVNQPWWNTFFAWFIYICIMCGLAYAAWRFYLERLERRYFNEKINFFVNTAHDIRTPLSLILAPLNDIAADNSLSDTTRKYLNVARQNGGKLLKMVTKLLDFQKADNDEVNMCVSPLNLKQLLQTQIEKFVPRTSQKNIIIALESCPEEENVWMDTNMADSIFENLISNAVKYTPEGGYINICARIEDNEICIDIADNGIGIPQTAQKHIFQNFYRADNAINSNETGSGLGLMLTHRLIKLHKGSLTFNSLENSGTVFHIRLKRGFEHLMDFIDKQDADRNNNKDILPIESIDREEDVQLTNDKSKDIMLFVDDNAELRNYISMTFRNNYNVVTVESAEEALRYLDNEVCDIIVSDVMMPGMDGDEFCKIIKENPDTSFLPVILLTAKSGRDFVIGGLNVGADDYITKPFDVAILKGKIESMLRNRRILSKYYMGRSIDMARNVQPDDSTISHMNNNDRKFIEKATKIVMDKISDTDFKIDDLCIEMAMSRTLFYGKLKALTSQTPQDFIRILRLERAAVLIKEGNSVLDVSVMTGFANVKHFSTTFKKHFGVSPSKYL